MARIEVSQTVRIVGTADDGKTGIVHDIGSDGFATVRVDGVLRLYAVRDLDRVAMYDPRSEVFVAAKNGTAHGYFSARQSQIDAMMRLSKRELQKQVARAYEGTDGFDRAAHWSHLDKRVLAIMTADLYADLLGG